MEKETFGDYEILGEALKGLTGAPMSGASGDSFPLLDPPKDDDIDDVGPDDDVVDKTTGGFKDERTKDDNPSIGSKTIDDILGDEDEDVDDTEEPDEEPSDEPDGDDAADTDGDDPDTPKDEDGFGDLEPDITAVVQEKLFDRLGWELTEDDKLDSVGDLVDYMEKIVEANSKPEYASDEISELNEFVKNGGKLQDYFNVQGEIDLDSVDLSVEFNQKAVLKETLKERGMADAQIDKKISRYEETGILEDEALEAKDYLKKVRDTKADRLLEEQKVLKEQTEKQQQKFYEDVASNIDALENVRGVKVTQAKKNKLKDALLKVGNDGQTLYQKKYQENLIKNFIESAFFTLEEDALIKDMQRQAESKATKNLKNKLETKTKRGKATGAYADESNDDSVDHSVLNAFGSLIKP
jgi:hypothetical protein